MLQKEKEYGRDPAKTVKVIQTTKMTQLTEPEAEKIEEKGRKRKLFELFITVIGTPCQTTQTK